MCKVSCILLLHIFINCFWVITSSYDNLRLRDYTYSMDPFRVYTSVDISIYFRNIHLYVYIIQYYSCFVLTVIIIIYSYYVRLILTIILVILVFFFKYEIWLKYDIIFEYSDYEVLIFIILSMNSSTGLLKIIYFIVV